MEGVGVGVLTPRMVMVFSSMFTGVFQDLVPASVWSNMTLDLICAALEYLTTRHQSRHQKRCLAAALYQTQFWP